MTRGKRLACPRIVVTQAAQPRFTTREEAWDVVGPVLARILAQTILREQAKQERRSTRKKRSSR